MPPCPLLQPGLGTKQEQSKAQASTTIESWGGGVPKNPRCYPNKGTLWTERSTGIATEERNAFLHGNSRRNTYLRLSLKRTSMKNTAKNPILEDTKGRLQKEFSIRD